MTTDLEVVEALVRKLKDGYALTTWIQGAFHVAMLQPRNAAFEENREGYGCTLISAISAALIKLERDKR